MQDESTAAIAQTLLRGMVRYDPSNARGPHGVTQPVAPPYLTMFYPMLFSSNLPETYTPESGTSMHRGHRLFDIATSLAADGARGSAHNDMRTAGTDHGIPGDIAREQTFSDHAAVPYASYPERVAQTSEMMPSDGEAPEVHRFRLANGERVPRGAMIRAVRPPPGFEGLTRYILDESPNARPSFLRRRAPQAQGNSVTTQAHRGTAVDSDPIEALARWVLRAASVPDALTPVSTTPSVLDLSSSGTPRTPPTSLNNTARATPSTQTESQRSSTPASMHAPTYASPRNASPSSSSSSSSSLPPAGPVRLCSPSPSTERTGLHPSNLSNTMQPSAVVQPFHLRDISDAQLAALVPPEQVSRAKLLRTILTCREGARGSACEESCTCHLFRGEKFPYVVCDAGEPRFLGMMSLERCRRRETTLAREQMWNESWRQKFQLLDLFVAEAAKRRERNEKKRKGRRERKAKRARRARRAQRARMEGRR